MSQGERADGDEPQGLDQSAGFRSGILHGRRQGRRLRDMPSALMRDRLPAFLIAPGLPLDAETLFGRPSADMRLEIGFGGGEHLVAEAERHPAVGFIGCEPFRNGVAGLLQQLEGRSWPNLRLHMGDAGEIVDRLPDASLVGVDLLYPDPWPKRRQRKRRFVSDANLARLARVMKSGSVLRFATDIDDYAGWTLARILASSTFAWHARAAVDWREPWLGWTSTRYEQKAMREGRRPVYLTFERV